MIQEQFVKQIQEDSFGNILRVTTILAVVAVSIQFVFLTQLQNRQNLVLLAIHIAFIIIISRWSSTLVQKKNRQEEGTYLFIGGYMILIAINFSTTDNTVLENFLPYLYAYFIIISSTLIRPQSSFDAWFISVILLIIALFVKQVPLTETFVYLVPILINLVIAIASFFTTIDWQDAVESTSILQYRAQQRRDELFAVQADLKDANAQAKALYRQLFTSVEVGQRIVTLLDQDVLLQQVADLIKNQLDYIYVGIFLVEHNRILSLRVQIGNVLPIGAQEYMPLEEINTLTQAVSQRKNVVISNVAKTDLPPHPYLSSGAKSEVGLALIVGEQLYGVLNIQSYKLNGFTDETLPILRLLADQVAIALHNAHLFKAATQARHEAERANEIKSRFLASMSHELRTPLNAILNFTGFVSDGIYGPVNDEQVDALEKSLDSGNHLLSLINDILDLSKIEAGAMDMFIEAVNISALLNSLAATAKGLLKNKPINLLLDIDQNLPTIQGDKRRLRQVLLNLVSNAVKFTKEGDIVISARQTDDYILMSVKDSGIGIPPKHQALVFESFHQVENEIYNELGTGLGLPISKHFVESHNGDIWLESVEGEGTTFFVRLPVPKVINEPIIDTV